MNAESRVLAVIEPDAENHRAIERGAVLAEGLGLPLELLDVVYDQFVENDEKAVKSLLARRRQSAETQAKYFGEKIEKLAIEVRWGRSLADQVLKRVDETNPAFVVKNTHHHSVLERTLLSHADWDLIRNCPAPLVLAKDRALAGSPQVLAAIDPAEEHDKPEALDRVILETGKQISKGLSGNLHPVHVLDSARLTRLAPAVPVSAMTTAASTVPLTEPLPAAQIAEIKRERRELLDQLAAAAGLDPDDCLLVVGEPANCLIESAVGKQADFVVMGAVARGIVDRIMIGHTAERILDRLPCDLVVVKAGES